MEPALSSVAWRFGEIAYVIGSMRLFGSVANPHDKLFKGVFDQPQNAASHFRQFLPAEVVKHLNLDAMELRPGSFVDKLLEERHADLLYEVPFYGDEGRAFLYILFEHQSSSDPLMPLRLLRYMLRIWDAVLEREPLRRRLPPVLPVVLYHSPAGWHAPLSVGELLEGPTAALQVLEPHVPQFSLILNDLSVADDDELRQGAMDGVVRLLFKHIWDGDLSAKLVSWGELLHAVASTETGGLQSFSRVIEYLLQASDVPIGVIEQVFTEHVDPKMREMIRTTADQLRSEGRQEGRQEGRLEGRAEDVVRLLERRNIQIDDIARSRILACRDEVKLERWFDRALFVSAAGELFNE